MKNRFMLLVLLVILGLQACTEEKVEKDLGTRRVRSFDKIAIDGDIIVKVHQAPAATGEIEVKINSSPDLYAKIGVTSQDGTLLLTAATDITLARNVVVELAVPQLSSIKLENTQQASFYFVGDFHIPTLDIVTEAESKLQLYNLQADVITSRQEGQSALIISSALDPIVAPLTFSGQVVQLDSRSILIDNKILVTGGSIEVNTTVTPHVYTVLGSPVKKYYLAQSAQFITQGTTTIDAANLYVRTMDIKLEGESRACVWVKELLRGKGEGNSILSYTGSPQVLFTTSGGAKILNNN